VQLIHFLIHAHSFLFTAVTSRTNISAQSLEDREETFGFGFGAMEDIPPMSPVRAATAFVFEAQNAEGPQMPRGRQRSVSMPLDPEVGLFYLSYVSAMFLGDSG